MPEASVGTYFLCNVYAFRGRMYLVAADVVSLELHSLRARGYTEKHLVAIPESRHLPPESLQDLADALRHELSNPKLRVRASPLLPFEGAWRGVASEAVVEIEVEYVGLARALERGLQSPSVREVLPRGGTARYLHPQDSSEGRFLGATGLRVGSCFTCGRAPDRERGGGSRRAFAALYEVDPASCQISETPFDPRRLKYVFLHATRESSSSAVRAVHVAYVQGGELTERKVFATEKLGSERSAVEEARESIRAFRPALLLVFKNPLPHSSRAVPNALSFLSERSALYSLHGWGLHAEDRPVWRGALARGLAVVDLHSNLTNSYLKLHSHTLAALRTHPNVLRAGVDLAAAAPPAGFEAYAAEWLEVHVALQYAREQRVVENVFAQAKLYCATPEVNQRGPQAAAASPFFRELEASGLYRNEAQAPLLLEAKDSRATEASTSKGYSGGYVRAEVGRFGLSAPDAAHRGFVFVFDFASMYPANIQALRLCPSSVFEGDDDELAELLAKGEIAGECVALNERADVFVVHSRGGRAVESCLPRIIRRGVEARKAVRERLEQLPPGDALAPALEAEQLQIKRLTNAWYGLTGNDGSVLTHIATAAATTRRGREDIQRAESFVGEQEQTGFLPPGARVVNIDTDSVFVFYPAAGVSALPSALERAQQLNVRLNELFVKPCKMELEKVFTELNVRGKKKYSGLAVDTSAAGVLAAAEGRAKGVSKGMVANKRSVCALVSAACAAVEKVLQSGEPLEAVAQTVERSAAGVLARGESVEPFVLSCALAREYTNEETTVGPRLKRRYKEMFHFEVEPRTRIPYVVVEKGTLLADKVRFPEEVTSRELDTLYYLKQLTSSLRQTCEGYEEAGWVVANVLDKARSRAFALQSRGSSVLSTLVRPRPSPVQSLLKRAGAAKDSSELVARAMAFGKRAKA